MSERSPITTHVLDTTRGCPAAGIPARLEYKDASGWRELAQGKTDADGRITNLLSVDYMLQPGLYQLTFDTREYFSRRSLPSFYPYVPVVFEVTDRAQHYHVPLLLNPFSYSTYRGS